MSIPPEVHQLFHGVPITCHAFSGDRTQVAVSPASHQVHIYRKNGAAWTLAHVLDEHDKLVTSIDWAPQTNRIVSCAQDRNAYVWVQDPVSGLWKPQLVLLRINRAATQVRWSPREDKFAVATGSRLIAVAHYDADNDYYISKHIRKPIRSTVLSIQWHPENILLAAGCADMKARVFSAWVKGIDAKAANPVWGEKLPFGTLCGEFGTPNGGWVHDAAFSPSGNILAWVGHDGNVSFSYGPAGPVFTALTTGLPLVSLVFVAEDAVVAAGHDCVPFLFRFTGAQWELVDRIDKGASKVAAGDANSAMAMFKTMASRGQATTEGVELNSRHQNTITSVRAYAWQGDRVTHFSTSGVDGKLIIWRL
ncbi:WD40-repeat-containing domain protein [Chytriomyces sp. MP71]|nr:WD40-repeat-containing domain protein [Chytriomyces sp. MP71]